MCYGLQNLLQTPAAHFVAIVLELAFIEELISTLESRRLTEFFALYATKFKCHMVLVWI